MKITSLLSKLILEQSRFQVLYDKMVKPSAKSLEKDKKAKGLMDFDALKTIIFALIDIIMVKFVITPELYAKDPESSQLGKKIIGESITS